ncbi:hypothetical protein AAVH_12328 [Aphelenchoides avenae]|nr:hypothetical protein AAVH_12328 [Aphelenchus avenae]
MSNHEDIYEATNYYKKGVATGKVRRMKRTSLNVKQSASGSQAASEAVVIHATPGVNALDVATDDAANGPNDAHVPNEVEPDAGSMPGKTVFS